MKLSLSANPRPLSLFVLLVLFIRLAFLTYTNRSFLLTPFDTQTAHYLYTHSQYNLEHAEFLGNIQDDLLYSYAGARYLSGTDPSLINFEAPYLIKYLYGLSILVSGNAVTVQYLLSLTLLIATFVLAWQITGNFALSLLAPLLLTFDPTFVTQTFSTLLDLPLAFCIVASLAFFTLYLHRRLSRYLIAASIFLGCAAGTKLFTTALILFLVFLPHLLSKKKLFLASVPALTVYLATHTIFFWHHHNLADFIHLHVNTFRLYKSYLPDYPWGEFVRIVFRGRWLTWWGQGIVSVSGWTLLWPLTFAGTLSAYFPALRAKHAPVLVITNFVLLYFISNLIHVVFPRYYLAILPLTIILSLYTISRILPFGSTTNPS